MLIIVQVINLVLSVVNRKEINRYSVWTDHLVDKIPYRKKRDQAIETLIRRNEECIKVTDNKIDSVKNKVRSLEKQLPVLTDFVQSNNDNCKVIHSSVTGVLEYLNRIASFRDFVNGKLLELYSDPKFNFEGDSDKGEQNA